MKPIGKLGMTLCFAAALGSGATWTGKLIDASCYDSRKTTSEPHGKVSEVCAPSPSTTSFAFRTSSGKVYKIDDSGNSKLASDIQNGVLKKDKDGDIHAVITGKRKAGVVKLNSVVVSK